jgi:hypothetical protein
MKTGQPDPGAGCNICEQPATMHVGAGPRCDTCQHHEGQTLAELRAERDRIDRLIQLRTQRPERPARRSERVYSVDKVTIGLMRPSGEPVRVETPEEFRRLFGDPIPPLGDGHPAVRAPRYEPTEETDES